FFGINNGNELVHEIKRKLLPYHAEKQPIYLLQKNGKRTRLHESEDQLLSGLMVNKTTRYILMFQEISPEWILKEY
ncbi:phosphohydrolase, partial [Chryseobacterium sp. 1B4]